MAATTGKRTRRWLATPTLAWRVIPDISRRVQARYIRSFRQLAEHDARQSLNARIIQAQTDDAHLERVIESKLNKAPELPFSEWRDDPTLKTIWRNYERLLVKDGLLIRSNSVCSPYSRFTIVIPEALIPQVLQGMYDSPLFGHWGVTRTEDRIRQPFFLGLACMTLSKIACANAANVKSASSSLIQQSSTAKRRRWPVVCILGYGLHGANH